MLLDDFFNLFRNRMGKVREQMEREWQKELRRKKIFMLSKE
jgi:hypothetical protein